MIANQSLGVRIRYFRKKKGFTQKELGEAIGVNDSTIRNYELGNRTPDANTMAKIAEALEIDFYTLKSTEVNSVDSAVHALFDIEDRYGLVPDKIGDNICLVLDLNSVAWFQGYHFSYEILPLNALLTMAGLWLLKR